MVTAAADERAAAVREFAAGLTLAEFRDVVREWAAKHLGPVRYFCLNAVSAVCGCPDTQIAFTPATSGRPSNRASRAGT